jgi:hypothetical protein
MSETVCRRKIVVADGTCYEIASFWATNYLAGKPKMQVLAAKSSRLKGIRKAMLANPLMHEDGEGSFVFFQGKVKFDASEVPSRGDHLLLRRITDGRVLEVTPPVIQVRAVVGSGRFQPQPV